jgi:hypothetical protein
MLLFVVQGGFEMAHFAELNGSNVVQRVCVFSNSEISSNGGDWSDEAETFIETRMSGSWKQCSYNANQRGRYPGVGWTWNASLSKFQEPKPFDSWSWNNTANKYQAPITEPNKSQCEYTIGSWTGVALPDWDEDNTRWSALFADNEGGADDSVNHSVSIKYWNPDTTAWVDS